ncbi:Universal stress protein A family protein C25B2.10 [Cladobotryum mycophilum]|uniref:Universal stress protein A family protein C25B2.10 n=1 Tax=Cladobotryum mycophilum TaxID=491253 RepID=A0ABR0T0P4_9HYPO
MLSVQAVSATPRSSDSDISPTTSISPDALRENSYFASPTGNGSLIPPAPPSSASDTSSRRPSTISFIDNLPKPETASLGRTCSSSSKRRPRGLQRLPSDGSQVRSSSPPYERFQRHVGFDNVPSGEATKNNTLSLTLNVRHKGYQARRRSRTFMVGVDEHSYSDYAIQWLLDELVDDGDEIVCVRVIEKDIRLNDKQYQEDAQHVMQGILNKNAANRAISFVLEYAVGKLHATFQKLIQMYQPAMLIVGTRGRSLGGIQGLVNTRNSFSKYCLQYSPIPVVVVRPTEKRIKKKAKRSQDNTRHTYLSMLSASNGKHEADSEASSTYEMEVQISPDEEAHQVAKVLGLPAAFDPTIKPLLSQRSKSPDPSTGSQTSGERSESRRSVTDTSPPSAPNSDEEDEDDEGEFEVMSGTDALSQQQKLDQLHKMEVGEAAALRTRMDEDEDDSDEAQPQDPTTASVEAQRMDGPMESQPRQKVTPKRPRFRTRYGHLTLKSHRGLKNTKHAKKRRIFRSTPLSPIIETDETGKSVTRTTAQIGSIMAQMIGVDGIFIPLVERIPDMQHTRNANQSSEASQDGNSTTSSRSGSGGTRIRRGGPGKKGVRFSWRKGSQPVAQQRQQPSIPRMEGPIVRDFAFPAGEAGHNGPRRASDLGYSRDGASGRGRQGPRRKQQRQWQ